MSKSNLGLRMYGYNYHKVVSLYFYFPHPSVAHSTHIRTQLILKMAKFQYEYTQLNSNHIINALLTSTHYSQINLSTHINMS